MDCKKLLVGTDDFIERAYRMSYCDPISNIYQGFQCNYLHIDSPLFVDMSVRLLGLC